MGDPRLAELISKMAHELRSPLTSVKGFSSMLMQNWDRFNDEQKFQFIETIHHDAERMGRIVTDILDLSRLESGRLELRPSVFPLAEAVDAARGFVEMLDGSDRVMVEVPETLHCYGDQERLQSVLANLLENAIKFSDTGPVTVTGSALDGQVIVEVSDTGDGIPADRLPAIFDGPGPTGGRTVPSGTGLGLYLARGIVEAHGGTIAVESEEGEGSKFRIALPETAAASG